MTQKELLLSYYKQRPNEKVKNSEAEDWARSEAERLGMPLRNPGRVIRKLSKEGYLEPLDRGEYVYKP